TVAAFRLPRTAKDTSRPVDPVQSAREDFAPAPATGPPRQPRQPGPGAGLVTRPAYQYEPREPAGGGEEAALGPGAYGPPTPAGVGGSRDDGRGRGGFFGGMFGKISPRLEVH